MDELLIFKQTALDADLNFSEQYDLIDLIYDAQNTVIKSGNCKSISSCQCPLCFKSLHYLAHCSTCMSRSDPSSWASSSIYVLFDSTSEIETAAGIKSMSNIVTCTFLTVSLTKPQSISMAWSQLVYLNK